MIIYMSRWKQGLETKLCKSEDEFWRLRKLEVKINEIKDKFASFCLENEDILVREAIEKIKLNYDGRPEEEKQLLEASIERLKLYNVLDKKVKRYLPLNYFPSKKNRNYVPEL